MAEYDVADLVLFVMALELGREIIAQYGMLAVSLAAVASVQECSCLESGNIGGWRCCKQRNV